MRVILPKRARAGFVLSDALKTLVKYIAFFASPIVGVIAWIVGGGGATQARNALLKLCLWCFKQICNFVTNVIDLFPSVPVDSSFASFFNWLFSFDSIVPISQLCAALLFLLTFFTFVFGVRFLWKAIIAITP